MSKIKNGSRVMFVSSRENGGYDYLNSYITAGFTLGKTYVVEDASNGHHFSITMNCGDRERLFHPSMLTLVSSIRRQ